MPGPQSTIGYKPVANPSGWGGHAGTAGVMRGTTVAGRSTAYWLVRQGGRVGRFNVSGDSTIRYAAYLADKNTLIPGNKLGETGTVNTAKRMIDNAGGDNLELPLTAPVPVAANQPVTLALLGTGNPYSHGQDNSGAIMHERTGLSTPPSPFASTNSRPEGKIAIWGVIYDNVTPTIPLENAYPAPGDTITTGTPTIEVDFRSDNELLPGFNIGDADKVSKFQIQIWNEGQTVKHRDSGVVNADNTMKTNRRVTYAIETSLPAGTYVGRAQVYNHFGTTSAWVTWTFTIVSAGSLTITAPTGRINGGSPDLVFQYSHASGTAMDKIEGQILNKSGSVVVRAAAIYDFPSNPGSPSTGAVAWASFGWVALEPGEYQFRARAIDTAANPSPWTAKAFRVNAAPLVPINRKPDPGAIVSQIPILAAMARDNDDPAALMPTEFAVRRVSTPGTVTTKIGTYFPDDNRWRMNLLAEGVIGLGDYDVWEWRCRSTDPWGGVGEWSTWLTFEYVAPPTVAATAPTGTIAVANPPFTWTVDRAQSQYRLQLFDDATDLPIKNGDTGWIVSTTKGHTYPSLMLRHGTTVRGVLDVLDSNGIPGSHTWNFSVSYTPPPTVTGVTAGTVQMAYDWPGTPTGVRIGWNQVTAPTSPKSFSHYTVTRFNPETGIETSLVVLREITNTVWVDETAPIDVECEYRVYQSIWDGLDLIPSLPGTATATVPKIVGTVISTVIGPYVDGVCVAFWDTWNLAPVTDSTIRTSWAAKPREVRGPMRYRVFTLDAYLIFDHEDRWDWRVQRRALDAMSDTWVDDKGLTRTRTLCLRLWDGTYVYGSITRFSESGEYHTNRRSVHIEFTETDYQPGVN